MSDLREIQEMNSLMKSLEKDLLEMEKFNAKLVEIISKKQKLDQFYHQKWRNYYDEAQKFNGKNLEILNQDSLWNVLVNSDKEARQIIRISAQMI